jgi:hypothetical protein
MGRCTFCDRKGNSREHAWPEWLLKYFGGSVRAIHRRTESGQGRLDAREIKVKTVCKQCNEGWMSGLESRASLSIKPMARGCEHNLGQNEAIILATWAVKTAAMLERASGSALCLRDEDFRYIKEHLAPPAGVAVWLGRAASGPYAFHYSSDNQDLSPSLGVAHSTIVVGQLVFVVIYAVTTEIESGPIEIEVDDLPGLTLIWPSESEADIVSWPPQQAFVAMAEVEQLSELAKSFESLK